MVLTYSKTHLLGSKAPGFSLKGVDGKTYRLENFLDKKALVMLFMCNHCPYVIAVEDRILKLAEAFQSQKVAFVGINANDASQYPEDSFENMQKRAQEKHYLFPYLWDETQSVAKAYHAVCTPDPFVYENVEGTFLLRYHGRIDDNWKNPHEVKKTDLKNAIEAVLCGAAVDLEQIPSMGCSIKWK